MYTFSQSSKAKLETVNNVLKLLMEEAISSSPIDFGITHGHRTAEEQHKLFLEGKSNADGYKKKSKHQESTAVDIVAYIDGKVTWDRDIYLILAGHIFGVANRLGIKIRWGGDWNMNWNLKDQSLNDYVHYELVF